MKQTFLRTMIVAGIVCTTTTVLHSQQVPLPTTAAQVPGPASGTAMTKPYVQMVARMAYFWGWPLVNAANRPVRSLKLLNPDCWAASCPSPTTTLQCSPAISQRTNTSSPAQTKTLHTVPVSLIWIRRPLLFKCRTSVIDFGSMPSMTAALTSLQKSASNTAPNPASI
jgi:hypothetical protein